MNIGCCFGFRLPIAIKQLYLSMFYSFNYFYGPSRLSPQAATARVGIILPIIILGREWCTHTSVPGLPLTVRGSSITPQRADSSAGARFMGPMAQPVRLPGTTPRRDGMDERRASRAGMEAERWRVHTIRGLAVT